MQPAVMRVGLSPRSDAVRASGSQEHFDNLGYQSHARVKSKKAAAMLMKRFSCWNRCGVTISATLPDRQTFIRGDTCISKTTR